LAFLSFLLLVHTAKEAEEVGLVEVDLEGQDFQVALVEILAEVIIEALEAIFTMCKIVE
jgi:hypothetical protein